VRKLGLEGVVAKWTDSIYEPGVRSGAWIKHGANREQDFVIGGYIPGARGFDALRTIDRVASRFIAPLSSFHLLHRYSALTSDSSVDVPRFEHEHERQHEKWRERRNSQSPAQARQVADPSNHPWHHDSTRVA
jgi:hypothetical protein